MSKKILQLILLFSLTLSIIPQFLPALAGPPCKGLPVEGGRTVDYWPVDEAGNRLSQIPDGMTALRIKFVNLGPGYYRLAFPRRASLAYTTGPVHPSPDGSLTLIIHGADDKLANGTHTGDLQKSTNNDWSDVPLINDLIGSDYNSQYCRDVTYTVGYNWSACSLTYTPNPPASNQRFTISVSNAPAGSFSIKIDERLIRATNAVLGSITIGTDGRGSTGLLGPLSPGTYPIYIEDNTTTRNDLTFDNARCRAEVTVVGASSAIPNPHCSIIVSGKDYTLRASNLRPNVDYGVYLSHNGNETKVGTDRNSLDQQSLDQLLISNPPAGTYIASAKDAEGNGCTAPPFEIGSDGQPVSGLPGLLPPQPIPQACSEAAFERGECTTARANTCSPPGFPDAKGIQTAIGCVPTEPATLIKAGLRFLIGIAGGIAFLLMILGAFGMITSAGNPEALEAGRDRFVKAIEGLLFIIFATLLLGIIGVDLLGLGQYFGF